MGGLQKALQAMRQQKGLTQGQLAKLTGITQAMISKVESGKDVRLSTLETIAEALELTITAVTHPQAFQLRRHLNPNKQPQSLLEQFQVKDDD